MLPSAIVGYLCVCAIVTTTTESASLQKDGLKKIPVEVVYLKHVNEPADDEKLQEVHLGALRNLDAKPQLSPEDLSLAAKHIPALRIVTPDEPQQQQQEYFKPLGFRPSQINYPLPDGDDASGAVVIQAQEYVNNGITQLRQAHGSQSPQIEELQSHYDGYFESLRQQANTNATTTPSAGGLFQNVVSGIQSIASNFVGGANSTSGENDDGGQRPTFGQTILNTFNQITSNLSSTFGLQQQQQQQPSTVLGDGNAGVTSSPPTSNRPLQIVQGIISNLNPFNSNRPQGNAEGDAQNATGGGPIQNLISSINPFGNGSAIGQGGFVAQIGQTVSNLNPLNQQQQPDQPQGPLQSAVNQIGQALNNINPFNVQRPQSSSEQQAPTAATAAAAPTGTSTAATPGPNEDKKPEIDAPVAPAKEENDKTSGK